MTNTFISNNNSFFSKQSLISSEKLAADNEYTIRLFCKNSINKHNELFSNFFKKRGFGKENLENFHLSKIFDMVNKKYKEGEFPFHFDNMLYVDKYNTVERLSSIISVYDDNFPKTTEEIKQTYFKGSFLAYGALKKEKGNFLRFIYTLDEPNHILKIVLIDPYHMLASHLSEQFYKENCNNQVKIEELIDEYKDLMR